MKKLRFIALNEDIDALLRALTALGCVELNKPQPAEQTALSVPLDSDPKVYLQAQTAVDAAITAIKPYTPKKSFLTPKAELTESELLDSDYSAQMRDVAKINEINASIRSINSEILKTELSLNTLRPWSGLSIDLSDTGGRNYTVEFATAPSLKSVEELQTELDTAGLPAQLYASTSDSLLNYFALVTHKSAEQEVWDILDQDGVLRVTQNDHGTASERIEALQTLIRENQAEVASLQNNLADMAYLYPALESLYDRLGADGDRQALRSRLVSTGRAIFSEAWVPEDAVDKVTEALETQGCAYEFSEPVIDEEKPENDPPVAFKVSKFVRSFTVITELYGMPQYSSVIDPNPFIAPFFLIFFGMMLADVGYGLIFMIATYIILKKAKPTGMLKSLLTIVFYGGISMTFWGVMYGSWFGDVISRFTLAAFGTAYSIPPLLFDPLTEPLSMLILSLGLGFVHIMIAMGLSAYRQIKQGHIFDAICDTGFWYMILVGLIIGLLGIKPGLYVAAAGAIGVILTGGRAKKNVVGKMTGGLTKLYDISGYLSDLLSYSRLLALGLTSSVVAAVINILATMKLPGVVGYVMFIIIFLFGHAFNITINVLGAAVHALRLQYVEFFSRFYQTGGRPFEPARIKTKYINIIK